MNRQGPTARSRFSGLGGMELYDGFEFTQSPYDPPEWQALIAFTQYLCIEKPVVDTIDDSRFDQLGYKVHCLNDLPYIWLIEGDAVRLCPRYEDWLKFLLVYNDQIRMRVARYRADGDVEDTLINAIRRLEAGVRHPDEPEYWDRILGLDHFIWDEEIKSNEDVVERRIGEGYGHPVFGREAFELAKSTWFLSHEPHKKFGTFPERPYF